MTEPGWVWEPRIRRRALTLIHGPEALAVALAIARACFQGHRLPGAVCASGPLACVANQDPRPTLVRIGLPCGQAMRHVDTKGRPFDARDRGAIEAGLRGHLHAPALTLIYNIAPDVELLQGLARLAAGSPGAMLAVLAEPLVPGLEGLAHSVLQVREIRGRLALVHTASRVGPLAPAVAFDVLGAVSWGGIVEVADDVPPPNVVDTAVSDVVDAQEPDRVALFILGELEHGPRAAREVIAAAEREGIPARTLRRRAEALGVLKLRRKGWQARVTWFPPGWGAAPEGGGQLGTTPASMEGAA